MQKLIQELFDRKVPEEYKKIIEEFDEFEGPDNATPLLSGLIVSSNEMKELLQEKIEDNTIFDLGCGRRPEPRSVAQEYNAKRYVGVDVRHLLENGEYHSSCDRGKRQYYYFGFEDMLGFVSKLRDGIGGVYLLSALDISKQNENTNAYLDALVKEISRSLTKGDIVIITGGTDDFFSTFGSKYGFHRMSFSDDKEKDMQRTIIYTKI